MLFSISKSDMEGETKCTLTEFADGTKLSGEVDISEGRPGWLEDKRHLNINYEKGFLLCQGPTI